MTKLLLCVLFLISLIGAQTRVLGPPCGGKCGMPPLLSEETPPWLGTDYCVEVFANCACPGKFAAQVLWIGNGARPEVGIEFPLSWAPGCSRWFTVSFREGAALKSEARWCLALPADVRFVGAEIVLQAVVLRTYCDDTIEILTTRAIGVTLTTGYE